MQDCVAEDSRCEAALERATFDLGVCRSFLGDDPTPEGVLGGVVAALTAVDVARIWWRRHHGPTGAMFPLDRCVKIFCPLL
jgi:hypothetical protein